jgi:hypothetical protein
MAECSSASQIHLPFIFKSRSIAIAAVILCQICAGSSYADCEAPKVELTLSSGAKTCVTMSQLQQLENSDSGSAPDDSASNKGTSSTVKDIAKGVRDAWATIKGKEKKDSDKGDESKKSANSAEGKCANSKMIGDKYQCDDTYNWIDNAQLINQVGQAGGAATVNTTGQLNSIKAQTAGTQSAVMEAAAKTQENAGMLQTTLGITNAAMGIYQIQKARQHGRQMNEINNANVKADGSDISKAYNDTTTRAIAAAAGQTAVLDQAAGSGDPLIASKAAAAINKYGNVAASEQSAAQSAAMAAGVRSTIVGVQQTLAGALAIGAAKQAKQMAGKLSDTTGTSYQLTSTNPNTGTLNPTTSTSINPGTSTDPAVASTDGNVAAGDVPTISPPLNPDATAGGPGSGPTAGAHQGGSGTGAGGSAGNPSIGVGSMSPAKGEQEQTAARMADNKANTSYGQAGGYAATAGGVSAEKSADLGFLANLLPKPQEEMGKNGILDYGGGRSPASMAPYSFLGKDVNIFQRISDRTTAKLKSGDLKSDLGS